MKILVIGGGGREHAIVWKLHQSPKVDAIYCAPGNGGTKELATNVPISATDIDGLLAFALENAIDLTVVGMDDTLMLGVVDRFREKGLVIFGPDKKAAIIEGSKSFSKDFMKKYDIPTAGYEVFRNSANAKAYIRENKQYPIVLKADGLALGKGVLICETEEEALCGVATIMEEKKFSSAGDTLVIEEFMTGREVSVLAFCDGKTVVPMASAQDHKRAYDEDKGPNTGGMGTFSPSPYYTKDLEAECYEKIFVPTIKGMEAEGRPFVGILFFGLMLTSEGPKTLEYNARFGDPEAQVVLPRMKNDLVEVIEACVNGHLDQQKLDFKDEAAVCVVMASGGYPIAYDKHKVITGTEKFAKKESTMIFHAGTRYEEGKLLTNGGRVLGLTALGKDLAQARSRAYKGIEEVQFENAHYRKDISIHL